MKVCVYIFFLKDEIAGLRRCSVEKQDWNGRGWETRELIFNILVTDRYLVEREEVAGGGEGEEGGREVMI